MNRYSVISFISMAITASTAYGMHDPQKKLELVLNEDKHPVTVGTIRNGEMVTLNAEESKAYHEALLGTLNSVHQNQDNSISFLAQFDLTPEDSNTKKMTPVNLTSSKLIIPDHSTSTESRFGFLKPVTIFGAGALATYLVMKYSASNAE